MKTEHFVTRTRHPGDRGGSRHVFVPFTTTYRQYFQINYLRNKGPVCRSPDRRHVIHFQAEMHNEHAATPFTFFLQLNTVTIIVHIKQKEKTLIYRRHKEIIYQSNIKKHQR